MTALHEKYGIFLARVKTNIDKVSVKLLMQADADDLYVGHGCYFGCNSIYAYPCNFVNVFLTLDYDFCSGCSMNFSFSRAAI